MSLKYHCLKTEHMLVYFRHAVRHRIGGPAKVVYYTIDTTDCIYIQYGEYHRQDGPAWMGPNKLHFVRGRKQANVEP
jgi:hypothetical protein